MDWPLGIEFEPDLMLMAIKPAISVRITTLAPFNLRFGIKTVQTSIGQASYFKRLRVN